MIDNHSHLMGMGMIQSCIQFFFVGHAFFVGYAIAQAFQFCPAVLPTVVLDLENRAAGFAALAL